ncbi:hypothetical protein H7171_03805 [Candidatus Saccharibacteria bacterium]|nr:hypothetical protein [Candidatus Saccharibacteria bacterium]
MSYESQPNQSYAISKRIIAGSLVLSLLSCEAATEAPQPTNNPPTPVESVTPQEVSYASAAMIVTNPSSDTSSKNAYNSCSATKIRADTYLSARHCWFTKTQYDKAVVQPYDMVASGITSGNSYLLEDSSNATVAQGIRAAVQSPVGSDISIFTVPGIASVTESKVATLPYSVNLKPYDRLSVTGFPARRYDIATTFEVEYMGTVSIVGADGNYAAPDKPQSMQAYVLPPGNPESTVRNFCEGGGMSGAGFINDKNQVVGVLSSVIDKSEEPALWQQTAERIGLTYDTQICLAAEVTSYIVENYVSAEGYVPPAEQLKIPSK